MNRLYTTKYGNYLLSILGACLVAFGLGSVIGEGLGNAAWLLVLIGVAIHGFAMFQTREMH